MSKGTVQAPPELHLPISLLAQYIFFLSRRPISSSNTSYLNSRLSGLKALGSVLETAGIPSLQRGVRRLQAIRPAAFQRMVHDIQLDLKPLASSAAELPADVVVSHAPLNAELAADLGRALLVFGPAIGIGDEIMCFPLPRWLQATRPGLEVTVASAYEDLWRRVRGVDRLLPYADHLSLFKALRGEPPYDGFDLVVLVEFETPELHPAILTDARLPLYVEIALGQRSARVVDNRRRWLHRMERPEGYFENYYSGLFQIARWLGLEADRGSRFASVLEDTEGPRRSRSREADAPLAIVVSPFTSKYDPSRIYWSHLISSLVAPSEPRPVRFLLDTGKGAATERFALAVQRSAAARVGANVSVELAPADGRRHLTLDGLLRVMEGADVVLCADTWSAHAAPLMGCTSLVVARPELEPWRVPHPRSFYFDAEDPIDDVIHGLRQVLRHCGLGGAAGRAPFPPPAARRLDVLTERLQLEFASGRAAGGAANWRGLYEEFLSAYGTAIGDLHRWPPEFCSLLADTAYDRPLRGPEAGRPPAALLRHLQDQLERWQNTNLRKYLRLSRTGAGEPRP